MTEIQNFIHDALDRYGRIRRKRCRLAAFAAMVLVLVLAAVLDRRWMFSGWARWSGWIVGLAAAAWAARRASDVVGHADAVTMAHRVEEEAGETVPVVATAIDPAVRRSAGRDELAGLLLDRLDLRAAEAMRAAPQTFPGLLRGPTTLAVTALVAMAVLFAFQGGQGLRRMLLPWSTAPYTSLVLEVPAEPIAEGRAFALNARVSGVPVEKVGLYRNGAAELLAEAVPDEQGLVRLTVDGLDRPAEFVIRGGDGQSAPLRIEPYSLPKIEAFEIAVTPPSYAGHTGDTETQPSFSAIRGSHLHYRFRLRAPAVSVVLERSATPREEERLSPEEQATLQRGPYGLPVGAEDPDVEKRDLPVFRPDPGDPLVWEADIELPGPEDFVYRLAIKGGQGDLVRNEEAWRINVLSDAPPEVRILGHNGGEVIKIGNETVRFDLSAVDDVRLAGVRLIFRKPGSTHVRQEIELPADTRRTWSGAELLALASLDLRPLDIVAVHAEAEDANALDGPGVGRSEVVYLEVPFPESEDNGGGGGGGGGGPPPINPLELQMEILRSTMVLPDDAPAKEGEALAHDQAQNAEYTGMIERAADGGGFGDLAAALNKARRSMESAAQLLGTQPPGIAIPGEEAALGFLIDAAKLLEEVKDQLQPGDAEGMMSFTLRPPTGKGPPSEGQEDKGEKERESLRALIEEVQRQLAEQQKLNQLEGEGDDRARQQQSLAQDARSAAGQAGGIPSSSGRRGDPRAAAEELARAAGLQEDNAEALADGDGEASTKLGAESAEALANALHELAAQLEPNITDGEAYPAGYERLVSDYLRSISYE
jgi:hypothetical protein